MSYQLKPKTKPAIRYCKICDKDTPHRTRSKRYKNGTHGWLCSPCRRRREKNYYAQAKTKGYKKPVNKEQQHSYTEWLHQQEIEYLGGKCIRCELTLKNEPACCFATHHVDSSTKDFETSTYRNAWSVGGDRLTKLKKELEKCVLLCIMCHKKVHAGIVTLKAM